MTEDEQEISVSSPIFVFYGCPGLYHLPRQNANADSANPWHPLNVCQCGNESPSEPILKLLLGNQQAQIDVSLKLLL